MELKVLYFGKLAEFTGVNEEVFLSKCNGDVTDLSKEMLSVYPQFETVDFQIAINKELGIKRVNGGDEIALLPPFAGG